MRNPSNIKFEEEVRPKEKFCIRPGNFKHLRIVKKKMRVK